MSVHSDRRRKARLAASASAALGGLAVIRSVLPAGTPPIRVKDKEGAERAWPIAILEKVRLGGSDQWILERSEDVRNPVLLYLHGGPGTSQLTSNRRNTRHLERYFTVVNWDQRGAGKSYRAIGDTSRMNIGQFVADTRELTLYLLAKFHQERLVLAGHSWGSVIAALTVAKYPELYSCYVGIGQAARMEQAEEASYRWTLEQARKHGDRRAVAALVKMGPPPYQGDFRKKIVTERRYLARFGGEIHASRTGAFGLVVRNLLFSREYTVADRVNYFRGILGSMRLLWPELSRVDLFDSVPELTVPVFFMEGRSDWESPYEIAERYFDALKAPSKELIWFDRSAHLPNSEERDLFNEVMVAKVLPVACRGLSARSWRAHKKPFGQIFVRHMCARGEPSKSRPSAGGRKFRPGAVVGPQQVGDGDVVQRARHDHLFAEPVLPGHPGALQQVHPGISRPRPRVIVARGLQRFDRDIQQHAPARAPATLDFLRRYLAALLQTFGQFTAGLAAAPPPAEPQSRI